MPSYEYRNVDVFGGETRLVTLLPGKWDDDIRIAFSHVLLPLSVQQPLNNAQHDLAKIQRTLRQGWIASETIDGRLIFYKINIIRNDKRSSWTHPFKKPNRAVLDPPHLHPVRRAPPEVPTFEALSYCWGPPQPMEQVTVEFGELCHVSEAACTDVGGASRVATSSLSVGPNLASALRHLRRSKQARTLWIDALCINQNGSRRKSEAHSTHG